MPRDIIDKLDPTRNAAGAVAREFVFDLAGGVKVTLEVPPSVPPEVVNADVWFHFNFNSHHEFDACRETLNALDADQLDVGSSADVIAASQRNDDGSHASLHIAVARGAEDPPRQKPELQLVAELRARKTSV